MRALVEQAAVLDLLDLTAIDAISPGRRGSAVLQEVLSDWRPTHMQIRGRARLRSVLEARLLALIGAHQLPPPACNQLIEVSGERFEADLLWPRELLIVEADGDKFHNHPGAFERDRRRDRALLMAGYRVVRVTWTQLEAEAEAIVETIRGLLAAPEH